MSFYPSPDFDGVFQAAPYGAQITVNFETQQDSVLPQRQSVFMMLPSGSDELVKVRIWLRVDPFPPPPVPPTPEERRRKLIADALLDAGVISDRTIDAVTVALVKALADDFGKADRYEDLG